MTIGKRIGLGFGLVLAFLAVLAIGTYWSIGQLVWESGKVIESKKWPSEIADLKLKQLTWFNAASEYVANPTMKTLNIPTEFDKTPVGMFLTKKEDFLRYFPESSSMLKEIEESNRKLLELVKGISSVERKENTGLRRYLLQTVLADHRKYYENLATELGRELAGLTNYQILTKSVVQSAISIIKAIAEDPSLGSIEQRQEMAKKAVKALRYGPENKDYIWINDLHPKMVMHPYKPELDGKDLSTFEDKKGKKLFVEFANVCKKQGSGFVMYYWPKYEGKEAVPKISYVELFQPWGWILGTGVYLDERNEALMKRAQEFEAGKNFVFLSQLKEWRTYDNEQMLKWAQSMPLLSKYLPEFEKINSQLRGSARKIEAAVAKLAIEDALSELDLVARTSVEKLEKMVSEIVIEETKFRDLNYQVEETFSKQVVPLSQRISTIIGEIEKTVSGKAVTEAKIVESASKVRTFIGILSIIAIIIGIFISFYLTRRINNVLIKVSNDMSASVSQLSEASVSIANQSQSLAEGVSSQASSVQETASSLEELASMAKQNSQYSSEANLLVHETSKAVQQANEAMANLVKSIKNIDKASEETERIIKTIDEISFQTNLLALNAAVEAARAGEAGAGFAVVADEVRALAMRAAEAAKNTAQLIENTRRQVRDGSQYVASAEETFKMVEEKSKRITELIGEIAAASKEQAEGTAQINKAVSEIDKVIQQSAASSEEFSAVATQLNSQTQILKENIQTLFTLVQGDKGGKYLEEAKVSQKSRPELKPPLALQMEAKKHPEQKRTSGKESAKGRELTPQELIPLDDIKDF